MGIVSSGEKRSGCEADHLNLLSRLRMSGAIPPLPYFTLFFTWGARWRSWLMHCATSRKVTGSIPDGVIGIFHSYLLGVEVAGA
jgi:hypothetical protein